jgi:hypothetical protein
VERQPGISRTHVLWHGGMMELHIRPGKHAEQGS